MIRYLLRRVSSLSSAIWRLENEIDEIYTPRRFALHEPERPGTPGSARHAVHTRCFTLRQALPGAPTAVHGLNARPPLDFFALHEPRTERDCVPRAGPVASTARGFAYEGFFDVGT